MDLTDRYIKQCEYAHPLQLLDWEVHDGVFVKDGDFIGVADDMTVYEDAIWIPRQDELQDLVMPEFQVYGCDFIEHFMDAFHGFQEENNPLFDSMEELTLAFVMHQNYQKKWNGSEWSPE